jgi:uncharacterized paraquat-inducible protein A
VNSAQKHVLFQRSKPLHVHHQTIGIAVGTVITIVRLTPHESSRVFPTLPPSQTISRTCRTNLSHESFCVSSTHPSTRISCDRCHTPDSSVSQLANLRSEHREPTLFPPRCSRFSR